MIKALKSLIGLAGRDDATTEELTPSLPQAEAELAAAHAAQEQAEQAYKANLLTADDPTLRRLVEARTDAGVRLDRATALLAALRERLEAAEAREAEARRVTAYEAARVQADEARTALAEMYPALARDLVSLLQLVAEAELALRAANADLPAGAAPITPVEGSVRDIPRVPAKILSEITVERWVEPGHVMPGPFRQEAVHDLGGRKGVIKFEGYALTDCRKVELRSFTEQRLFPEVPARWASDLARKLELPGLRADDAPFWEPLNEPSPRQVIARIAKLKAPREPRPVQPVTRLTPASEALPLEGTGAA